MGYLILGMVVLIVSFILILVAFKTAINNSSMARDIKEIKLLLMKSQNERFKD